VVPTPPSLPRSSGERQDLTADPTGDVGGRAVVGGEPHNDLRVIPEVVGDHVVLP